MRIYGGIYGGKVRRWLHEANDISTQSIPISTAKPMTADEFYELGSDFYGGQSDQLVSPCALIGFMEPVSAFFE